MNKKIHILTTYHTNKDGSIHLGGLDVYLNDLANLLSDKGYDVFIHEMSPFPDAEFRMEKYHDVRYSGYAWDNLNNFFSNRKFSKAVSKSKYYSKEDLVIVGTDYLGYGCTFRHFLAIQHGIAWDVPFEKTGLLKKIRPFFLLQRKLTILKKCTLMVCVDHNYPNWIRANYGYQKLLNKIHVIPNYVSVAPRSKKSQGSKLKIVFARRFVIPRGTNILIEAIDLLSSDKMFSDLSFYLAGEGDQESYLKSRLKKYTNVHIEKYLSGHGLEYHKDKDIALVPTFGSEGTSLSALEAMSSGCALICTGVGGLSNIAISEFNSLIIRPDGRDLAEAIRRLFVDRTFLKKLQDNAVRTSSEGFNKILWGERWIHTIEKYTRTINLESSHLHQVIKSN